MKDFKKLDDEELSKIAGGDAADIVKCILENCGPITFEVDELVEAIQNKDIIKVYEILNKMTESGDIKYLDCFDLR